jgi:hypothetical protein
LFRSLSATKLQEMQFSTLFESILDWVAGFSGVCAFRRPHHRQMHERTLFPSAGQAGFVSFDRRGFSLIEGASAFDQTSG